MGSPPSTLPPSVRCLPFDSRPEPEEGRKGLVHGCCSVSLDRIFTWYCAEGAAPLRKPVSLSARRMPPVPWLGEGGPYTRETSDGTGGVGLAHGARGGRGGQPCHLLGLPRQYGACLQGTEVPVEGGQDGSRQKENKRRSAESVGMLGQGRKHLCLGRSGPAGAGAQTGGVSGGLEVRLRSLGPDGVQEGGPCWVQVPMPCLRADLGEPLPYQPCTPEKRPGLREGG